MFGHSTSDLKQAQGPSMNQLNASSHLALIAEPTSSKTSNSNEVEISKMLEPKVHTKGIFRHILFQILLSFVLVMVVVMKIKIVFSSSDIYLIT